MRKGVQAVQSSVVGTLRRARLQRHRFPLRCLVGSMIVLLVLVSGLWTVETSVSFAEPGAQSYHLLTSGSAARMSGVDGTVDRSPRSSDATMEALVAGARGTTNAAAMSSALFPNGAANRSPPRPRRRIDADPTGGRSGSDDRLGDTAMCFDRTGAATDTPNWFPALYTKMQPVYEAIREVAQEDPWQVLVGWVPQKFMPPQKPGRKANGDLMIPPTRGRNASYYLDVYNASWYTTVEANGYSYVFQLVHRNALAVCVRERLHVFQWYCAPSAAASAPVIVYHCPCRHCHEGSLRGGSKRTSMVKSFPAYRSPLLVDPLAGEMRLITSGVHMDPPRSNSMPPGCVDSLAAPWLVPLDTTVGGPAGSAPPATAFKFPYEGLHHDLDALLSTQSDVNKIVLVAIFNKFWLDHLHNFVYSMVTKARLVNFIVATMDDDALALCLKHRLPCFDATAYAEYEADMVAGGTGDKHGHKRKVSEAMSWIKPRLAVAVLRRGYGFLMSDLDLTWNKAPWKELLDVRVDIAHQCDANNKFSINSGFYFARANARTIRFFENLMVFTPEENSDQTAMKLFSRYDHTHGASNTCLPKWSFNMKCNYKVDGSVKRSGGVETFEWRPYDAKNVFWTILHATCLAGAHAKMLYLRTISAWRLDELDAITAGGTAPVCLWMHKTKAVEREDQVAASLGMVPTGDRRVGGGTTARSFLHHDGVAITVKGVHTEHTGTYDPTSTSDVFLQRRH